jgi:hypothetical protein
VRMPACRNSGSTPDARVGWHVKQRQPCDPCCSVHSAFRGRRGTMRLAAGLSRPGPQMRKRLNGGPRHIQWSHNAPSRKPPAQQCGGRRTAVHRSLPPPSQARCRRPTHAACGSASPFRRHRTPDTHHGRRSRRWSGGSGSARPTSHCRMVPARRSRRTCRSSSLLRHGRSELRHKLSLIVSVGGYAAPTISSHTTARAGKRRKRSGAR